MRHGRGASGGEYLERYDCDRAIADLDAVLAFVSAQSWADPARLLLGGMSRGALLSVAYPSRRPTNARGVINFAGGWMAERCDNTIRFNADVFAEAGRTGTLPMLWLYSENDRNYGPAAIPSYHRAFTQAGGTAELQIFPPIGHDGHILLPGAVGQGSAPVSAEALRLRRDAQLRPRAGVASFGGGSRAALGRRRRRARLGFPPLSAARRPLNARLRTRATRFAGPARAR